MKIKLSAPRSSPNSDRGINVNYPPAQRGGYRWQRYAIALAVLAPFVLLAWLLLSSGLSAQASGQVILAEELVLAPESGVVLPKVVINTRIAPGSLLASLDMNTPAQADKASQLSAERVEALRRDLAEMTLRLQLARERAEQQNKELATYRRLFDAGAATLAELSGAQNRALLAREEMQVLVVSHKALATQLGAALPTQNSVPPQSLYSRMGCLVQEAPTEAQWVERGTPLYRIVDPDSPPQLMVYFRPADMSLVTDKRPVVLRFGNGEMIRGRIDLGALSATQRDWRQAANSMKGDSLVLKARIEPDLPLAPDLRVYGLPFTLQLGWHTFWD